MITGSQTKSDCWANNGHPRRNLAERKLMQVLCHISRNVLRVFTPACILTQEVCSHARAHVRPLVICAKTEELHSIYFIFTKQKVLFDKVSGGNVSFLSRSCLFLAPGFLPNRCSVFDTDGHRRIRPRTKTNSEFWFSRRDC